MLHMATGCVFYGKSIHGGPWTEEDFCHDETIDLLTRVRADFELIDNPLQTAQR